MKIEDKLDLSEDREQILKIEDSPLKNQADGQLLVKPKFSDLQSLLLTFWTKHIFQHYNRQHSM